MRTPVSNRDGFPLARRGRRRRLLGAGRGQAGILLVECLVYISVFFVLTGIAYAVYYRSAEFSRDLRRNTEDIVRALQAGERWRQDVRGATAPPRLQLMPNDVQQLIVPQAKQEVAYWMVDGKVWRQAGGDTEPLVCCAAVKRSQMIRDARASVVSWRWELELKPAQKVVRMQPLFSFQAVPGTQKEIKTTNATRISTSP